MKRCKCGHPKKEYHTYDPGVCIGQKKYHVAYGEVASVKNIAQ